MEDEMDASHAQDAQEDAAARRPSGLIGAVDNVLRLLRLFEHHEVLRVNQVARDMGLSRSTVHRMLTTLGHHGFVEQDEFSRGYRPGPSLVDLGLAVFRNFDFRTAAHAALTRLRDLTDETVHLGVLRGTDMLFLDGIESRRVLRTGSRLGWTLPAHATAAGKAILAALPEEELGTLYPTGQLEAATPHTVTSLEVLRKQLAETRELGYAVNTAESETDVSAVALAVRGKDGRPRAAITVTAPRSRAVGTWAATTAATARPVIENLEKQMH
ncbi:IclR family transcriptional regulator [Streptomyces sp. NPDC091287]|uniref:IclR family transcriptional regulator n=1 Tax=Streptomyces sp. NPDC091287 TaxID=3365988 RepID=UPI00381EF5D2